MRSSWFIWLDYKFNELSRLTSNSIDGVSQYPIRCSFTADDSHVLCGTENGKIYIWELVSGKIIKVLKQGISPISCIDFHPKLESCEIKSKLSKRNMISSSFDGTITLWGC